MQITDEINTDETNTDHVVAEREFLQLLVKTCRAVRNPKNPRNRLAMSIPAAQWELAFEKRISVLDGKGRNRR